MGFPSLPTISHEVDDEMETRKLSSRIKLFDTNGVNVRGYD